MGVTNLWALLEPCGRRIDVKALRGKRVAIDASGWIFKFIKAMRDDQGELLPNAHLIGFFRRICKLLFHNIKPIFIFDGSTPVLKRQTVAERRRRRDQQEARVKKTAEKLLLNRLKQHALAQATAAGQQLQQRAPATNLINTINTTTATANQQQNNDNEAGPSTSRPREPTNTTTDNLTPPTGGVITDADFTIEDSESDSELLDFVPMLPEGEETIDPVVLATLPPSVQLEVMLRLRDRQQAANRGGFEERTGKPEEFSQFQINQYLKTSTLRRQLDTLRGAGAAANGAPRPVAAEEATEYVLERDEPEVVEPEQAGEGSQPLVSPTAAAGGAGGGIDLSFEIDKDEVVSDDGSLGWEDIEDDNSLLPGHTPGSGDGDRGGKGDEHWRERAARRQKYWSLSHGFQMGRKLAQWGEEEEPQQQRGRSPPAGVEGVAEDDDAQLQEAIRLSLVTTAAAATKDEQPGPSTSMPRTGGGRGVTLAPQQQPAPEPEKVPQQRQQQRQQVQAQQRQQVEIAEEVAQQAVENEEEVIEQQEINHPEFIPPPTAVVASNVSPTAAPALAAVQPVQPPSITKSVSAGVEGAAQVQEKEEEIEEEMEKEPMLFTIEEEIEKEVAAADIQEADPLPASPAPSQPSQLEPVVVVVEKKLQEDVEAVVAEEVTILPSKQATTKSAARPKVVRFAEPEALPTSPAPAPLGTSQQQQQQDEIMEEPSHLPSFSTQQEAAQFQGLLSSARPEQQQQQPQPQPPAQSNEQPATLPPQTNQELQQRPQNNNQQPPPPPPLDYAALRSEEASLRAEHRAAAGQSDAPTDIMFAECQELLQLFGLPYLIAPSEAEAQAAWLDAAGLVDGVVTDDNDAFLFGARRLYRNIFEEAKYVEEYRTDELESELGLTRERLVNLALLLGSDYTAGIAGVGVVNAVEIVSAFGGNHGLEKFAKWMKDVDEEIVALAKLTGRGGASGSGSSRDKNENEESPETESEKKFKQKHRNVRKTWNLPSGFPSSEVIAAYLEPKVDNSKGKFTFARPDLDLLRHFCAQKFGWEQARTDELLLPVLNAFDERQTQQTLDNFIAQRTKFAKIRSKRLREAVTGITGQDNQDLALDEDVLPSPAKKAAASRQRKNAKKKVGAGEEGDDDGEVIFVKGTPAPGTRGRGRGRGRTTYRRSRRGQEQERAALAAAAAAVEAAAVEEDQQAAAAAAAMDSE